MSNVKSFPYNTQCNCGGPQGKYVDGINYYKIAISDNGIGFDEKFSEDIFVVFKRLHSYHEFEGTGVGLSICKKIIDKHNGYLTAIGSLNEGATFVIEIPETQAKDVA